MNRVIAYLHHPQPECPCCAARREYARLKKICESIEADAKGNSDEPPFEFMIPSVNKLVAKAEGQGATNGDLAYLDDDELDADDLSITLLVCLEPRRASLNEDLRRYAVTELRSMAAKLTEAADRIEASGDNPITLSKGTNTP